MLPPRQQPRSGVLLTSLSLVPPDASGYPNMQDRGSNDSPTESASSRETWPTADAITSKQMEKEKVKEHENGFTEHSVIRHISSSDKMSLRDISRERVDVIAERMQHLPDEFLDKLKTELRILLEGTGGQQHREEFMFIQKLVQSRGDLTEKVLVLAHRAQLEILVAIKTGIQAFLHPSVSLSQASLIEVFLYKRCRNIACGSPLPVEACTCEICSKRNGFCNLCMCVICNKFDFEVNTCRWIGCDLCSHWTHTDCSIRNGQIGMGPCVKSGAHSDSGEMLFRCRACMRTSELLGWVKDVFHHCALVWDREALIRELEYVSRIFRSSEDAKGRKLFWKCEELVEKLKSGGTEPMACKAILSFFQELDIDPPTKHQESEEGRLIAPQEAFNRIADVVQEAIRKMEMVEEEKMHSVKKARLVVEACDQELKDKAREVAGLKMERQKKKQQIDELESIVRLKQAEADMFDLKASEARREAERLQRIILSKTEKSEEDYASRYLKQRLSEAEAEKQYLFEKMKLQEGSRTSQNSGGGGIDQSQMYSKIQEGSRTSQNSCGGGIDLSQMYSKMQEGSRTSQSSGGGGIEPSQMMMYSKIQDLLKNMYKGDGQTSDLHSLGGIP